MCHYGVAALGKGEPFPADCASGAERLTNVLTHWGGFESINIRWFEH